MADKVFACYTILKVEKKAMESDWGANPGMGLTPSLKYPPTNASPLYSSSFQSGRGNISEFGAKLGF